jgi:hypothetical protein
MNWPRGNVGLGEALVVAREMNEPGGLEPFADGQIERLGVLDGRQKRLGLGRIARTLSRPFEPGGEVLVKEPVSGGVRS